MSVYRVITRIIPLNSTESTFEPASFESLTDGSVGEIKVLNLTEPQSGMKYRIERIEYVQNVGPGETVDSINVAYAEKLKNIPGFVQLKANDVPLNPYDKSFQLTLPKVLSGKNSDETSKGKLSQQNKSSDSFKISVVKNYNFNKSNSSPKKKGRLPNAVKKHENSDTQNGLKKKRGRTLKSEINDIPKGTNEKISTPSAAANECESSEYQHEPKEKKIRSSSSVNIQESNDVQNESKTLKAFKTKYPSYLSKKIKNSVWGSKNKSSATKHTKTSPKRSKKKNAISDDCSAINNSEPHDCPTSRYVEANKDIDSRRNVNVKLPNSEGGGANISKLNRSLEKSIAELSDRDREDEEKTDTSLDLFDDLDYGDLIINVPEGTDNIFGNDSFHSMNLNTPEPPSSPAEDNLNRGAVKNDSFKNDSSESVQNNDYSLMPNQSENDQDESNVCSKYQVVEDHPLYELLMSLKKYFVNGECLICGFIPTESDFNASKHMETHISSNSFVSCFKCFCCDEKFANPRNLYQHALSRDKSYKYMCSICTLKFKRKHYLMRHTAKSH